MLIRGAPGAGPVLPELNRRLRWILVVMVTLFALLVGRLWQLQVVRGEQYYERALSNVVHKRYLAAVRGKIVDRVGVPFAANRPAFNILVVPRFFGDKSQKQLTRLLGLDAEEVKHMADAIARGRKRNRRQPVKILEDQGRDRVGLIRQSSFKLQGIEVHDAAYRYYPHGKLAAQLIGYMNKMTGDELVRLGPQGYNDSDLIGRYGLERHWENYLRGKKGTESYVANAKGQRIETADAKSLIKGPRYIPPIAGHDVVLTLDVEMQKLAQRAVRRHAAAAVAVVEVNTGRVLALVSSPTFDPNVMTGHLTRAEEALMVADPRKPFIDKTLRQHYPPGSTYKVVVAAAALEDGTIGDEEPLSCPGFYEQGKRTFRCTHVHGNVNMLQAIQKSCNVYFWKLSEKIGIDRMAEMARGFGFGAPTGLGLNGDVPGRVPTRAWYETFTSFKIGYTINAATGQGDVEVTVLQLVMAYAAIANGGTLYVPQVVSRVVSQDGRTVIDYAPRKHARQPKVSTETLDILRQGMRNVVNKEGGTAYRYARSSRVEFAGKTGTAQVRARKSRVSVKGWHPYRDHAWFAGYAPADNPEIAVVVLIEHGGPGGKVAGPVARRIIEGYFSKVKPAYEARLKAGKAAAGTHPVVPRPGAATPPGKKPSKNGTPNRWQPGKRRPNPWLDPTDKASAPTDKKRGTRPRRGR